jgi:hypothetical protein
MRPDSPSRTWQRRRDQEENLPLVDLSQHCALSRYENSRL